MDIDILIKKYGWKNLRIFNEHKDELLFINEVSLENNIINLYNLFSISIDTIINKENLNKLLNNIKWSIYILTIDGYHKL